MGSGVEIGVVDTGEKEWWTGGVGRLIVGCGGKRRGEKRSRVFSHVGFLKGPYAGLLRDPPIKIDFRMCGS